jgi:hypothetical protein
MKTPEWKYSFDAPIMRMERGLIKHYLPLPEEIGRALWEAGVRRVIATLNGQEFRRALSGRAEGGRCLIVGEPLLKEIRAGLNDMVSVTLRPNSLHGDKKDTGL